MEGDQRGGVVNMTFDELRTVMCFLGLFSCGHLAT